MYNLTYCVMECKLHIDLEGNHHDCGFIDHREILLLIILKLNSNSMERILNRNYSFLSKSVRKIYILSNNL